MDDEVWNDVLKEIIFILFFPVLNFKRNALYFFMAILPHRIPKGKLIKERRGNLFFVLFGSSIALGISKKLGSLLTRDTHSLFRWKRNK